MCSKVEEIKLVLRFPLASFWFLILNQAGASNPTNSVLHINIFLRSFLHVLLFFLVVFFLRRKNLVPTEQTFDPGSTSTEQPDGAS